MNFFPKSPVLKPEKWKHIKYTNIKNRGVVVQNKKPVELQKISEILKFFIIGYRNHLVHGESLNKDDHIGACIALQEVFCALTPFWDYQCVVQFGETIGIYRIQHPLKPTALKM